MMRPTASSRIEVRPALHGVRSCGTEAFLDAYFQREVLPLLTPIVLDRGHPLPKLRRGSWGIAVRFHGGRPPRHGVILVHAALPAAVEDPSGGRIPLAHLIARQVAALFDEFPIESCWTFRVSDADSFTGEDQQHELARFLSGAMERPERKLQEILPCAA